MNAWTAVFKHQHPHIRRIDDSICQPIRSPHPENTEFVLQSMATRRIRTIYAQYGFIAPNG